MRQRYGDLTATLAGNRLYLSFDYCTVTHIVYVPPLLRNDVLFVLKRKSHEMLHCLLDELESQANLPTRSRLHQCRECADRESAA